MGRVNRLMERRALRRAADQALLTSLGNSAEQAGGAPDQDFTYTNAEQERQAPVVEASGPAYDHDPVTAPIPLFSVEEAVLPQSVPPWEYEILQDDAEPADVYDLVQEGPAEPEPDVNIDAPVAAAAAATETPPDYRWVQREDDVVAPAAQPLRARPVAQTAYVRPELDFARSGYGQQQWYRTKPAAGILAAALMAAVACGGWLVFRSPVTTAQESQPDTPTSAAPSPSSAAPTAVSAPRPKPAPPPPPPPPPAEPTYSAPQRQYQPRYSEPTQAQKPRVDVTRAPMSVAPVPKPVPGSNSSTPGDAPGEKPRRRGCFGFC